MLHAVSSNVPPPKGSISFVTNNIQECHTMRDTIVRNWESTQYRVTANCIPHK